eukprot:56953-Chlamydomonas_euryale.AAC.6
MRPWPWQDGPSRQNACRCCPCRSGLRQQCTGAGARTCENKQQLQARNDRHLPCEVRVEAAVGAFDPSLAFAN